MTNNFSTIKNNQSSEKFYLLRIVPRRYINDDLTDNLDGTYSMTFPYFINGIKENGTDLSLTTGTPSSGEYSFNESTFTLTVYPTSISNNIIVYYYLFYTGGRYRVVNEDPENSATSLRDWQPKILSNPSLRQSIEDVIVGNLKVFVSGATISNTDHEFEDYLTENDSFNGIDAKIWMCLDSTSNIQKIFDGKVSSISLGNKIVSLSFDDPYAKLLEKCFMGDDESEVYFNKDTYSNLETQYENRPIYYFVGSASSYLTIPANVTNLTSSQKLDQSTLYSATNISYSSTVSTTTNREWMIGRVSGDGFLQFGFTPSNISNADPNYTRLDGTANQVSVFRVGDTFVCSQSGNDYYLRVLYVDRTNNYLYCTKEGAISTGAVIGSNNCPSIVVTNRNDQNYYCMYGRDYSTTVTTTSGGNKLLKITFVNNFEANHAGLTALDPGLYSVKFRIRPDTTNAKHGSVIKSILESAGLTVNSSSITTANTSYSSNCCFSIPNQEEGDYKNYINYVQDVLKSAFSYISLNNSFEIVYKLYSSPSSSNEITDVDIIKDSLSVQIKYSDIVNQIIAYNPHYSADENKEDTSNSPSYTVSDSKSKYLHNITRVTRFVHVMENINARLNELIKVRSSRYCVYDFSTKLINIDNILGDDIKLNTSGLLGNETTTQLKIVSLDKSTDKTGIIATDLLNL